MNNQAAGSHVLLFALALPVLVVGSVWMWAVPTVLSTASLAVVALLAVGASMVAVITWRNAQATSTVGQLLQATEAARPSTAAARLPRS